MPGFDTAGVIWYLAVLVLVGSALFSRRIQWRSAFGMILAWIGIFAVTLTLVSYSEELTGVARRVGADVMGTPRQQVEGRQLLITMARDGHYWGEGTINGTPARFLIDSGATITALSEKTARLASIEAETRRLPLTLNTANGTIAVQRGTAKDVAIGTIKATDLPVVISPAFGDVNVIGMNLLSQLKSWRVESGQMILEP